MRRLYVAPHTVWFDHISHFSPSVGSHCVHLIAYTSQANAELMHTDSAAWEALPEVKAWRAQDSPVLISTTPHGEYCEDVWHGHPDVALLPHPQFEGTDQLSKHKDSTTKKLKQSHLDALSIIGVKPSNTVWDVSDIASKMNPQCKLRAIL